MEEITGAIEYEAPRIEDYGDLTELTAGQAVGTLFDKHFNQGEHIPPNFKEQSGP
jgi:hypothetical protein